MWIWHRNYDDTGLDDQSLVRLRSAYIKRMALCTGAERCAPLLSRLSDTLNVKVGRLYYADNLQEAETLERSVDWIVRELRVTDFELCLCDNARDDLRLAMLPTTLTHHSMRATAEYLYVNVGF